MKSAIRWILRLRSPARRRMNCWRAALRSPADIRIAARALRDRARAECPGTRVSGYRLRAERLAQRHRRAARRCCRRSGVRPGDLPRPVLRSRTPRARPAYGAAAAQPGAGAGPGHAQPFCRRSRRRQARRAGVGRGHRAGASVAAAHRRRRDRRRGSRPAACRGVGRGGARCQHPHREARAQVRLSALCDPPLSFGTGAPGGLGRAQAVDPADPAGGREQPWRSAQFAGSRGRAHALFRHHAQPAAFAARALHPDRL